MLLVEESEPQRDSVVGIQFDVNLGILVGFIVQQRRQ